MSQCYMVICSQCGKTMDICHVGCLDAKLHRIRNTCDNCRMRRTSVFDVDKVVATVDDVEQGR